MPGRSRRGTYTLPELAEQRWPATGRLSAGEAPSVTTILRVLDKPGLLYWAAREERERMIEAARDMPAGADAAAWLDAHTPGYAFQGKGRKAMDLGSDVHAGIEECCRARVTHAEPAIPPLPEAGVLCLMAWQDWAERVNLMPRFVEHTVYSAEHRYAGTLDCVGFVDGTALALGAEDRQCVVFDWKTSNPGKDGRGVWPENLMQIAAYARASYEMRLVAEYPWAAVVRTPKTLEDLDRLRGTVEVVALSPDEQRPYLRAFQAAHGLYTAMKEIA